MNNYTFKKEAVDRYLNLKNNIEINKTAEISDDSSIDVTLLQAFGNEIIFDLPEPESSKILEVSHQSSNASLIIDLDRSKVTLAEHQQETCDTLNTSNVDSSIICVKNRSNDGLGLNKTIDTEDVNWHITKVSDYRIKDGKNQFKVHFKKVNKKKFKP